MFLRKGALKIYKSTEEYPCQSVISIKLQSNFIEVTLRHGCSKEHLWMDASVLSTWLRVKRISLLV